MNKEEVLAKEWVAILTDAITLSNDEERSIFVKTCSRIAHHFERMGNSRGQMLNTLFHVLEKAKSSPPVIAAVLSSVWMGPCYYSTQTHADMLQATTHFLLDRPYLVQNPAFFSWVNPMFETSPEDIGPSVLTLGPETLFHTFLGHANTPDHATAIRKFFRTLHHVYPDWLKSQPATSLFMLHDPVDIQAFIDMGMSLEALPASVMQEWPRVLEENEAPRVARGFAQAWLDRHALSQNLPRPAQASCKVLRL